MFSNKVLFQLAKKYVDENDQEGFCSQFMLMTPQMFSQAMAQAKMEAQVQSGLQGFGEVMKDRDALLTTLQTEVEKLERWKPIPPTGGWDIEMLLSKHGQYVKKSELDAIINKLRNEGM